MTALPSFVELMASLGLDNKSTPTQELPSPAIVVSSEHEQEHISSRIRVARYSPYGAPIVSVAGCPRSNPLNLTTQPPRPILTEGVLPRSLAMEQTLNFLTEYAPVILERYSHYLRARRSTLLRLATGPAL